MQMCYYLVLTKTNHTDMTYTITYTGGRTITDLEAESPDEARYLAEEIALPTEDVLTVVPNLTTTK